MNDTTPFFELMRVLRSIDGHLAALADQTHASTATTLSRADHDALVDLLPEIHEVVGEFVWSVHDIFAHEDLDEVLRATTPAKLGRLLSRADGAVVGRYRITRAGSDRAGVLWQVARAR